MSLRHRLLKLVAIEFDRLQVTVQNERQQEATAPILLAIDSALHHLYGHHAQPGYCFLRVNFIRARAGLRPEIHLCYVLVCSPWHPLLEPPEVEREGEFEKLGTILCEFVANLVYFYILVRVELLAKAKNAKLEGKLIFLIEP